MKTCLVVDDSSVIRKVARRILEGLEFLGKVGERVRIDQALPLALMLMEGLREAPGVIRMEMCGSLRRRKETIRDIDILVCADDADAKRRIMDLAGDIAGVRGIDGGALANAKIVEAITVLLVSINRAYKTQAGIRIAGVE